MANDLEGRFDHFQLFGHVLAKRLEVATTLRAGFFLRFNNVLFAGKVFWQGLVSRLLARRHCDRRLLFCRTFLCDQVLQASFKLFEFAAYSGEDDRSFRLNVTAAQ